MPFRCKCGRTFEKTDSFATHTSACALFHHRRMSESNAQQQPYSHPNEQLPQQQQRPDKRRPSFINTSSLLFIPAGLLSPTHTFSSTQTSSPTSADASRPDIASSVPNYFMPTGLSLQYAFEGARRRSMSYGSAADAPLN
ncbi:hypothetical protein BX666DRAFT_1888334 [Dichotomocladium elegans]|nr:hypothetical protein BX666DRAFT_1888334 [Dichotomocladium elegans]